jgi:hypothetical protein
VIRRHVSSGLSGAFKFDLDSDMVSCKWFMLPMPLDMPDEGTR